MALQRTPTRLEVAIPKSQLLSPDHLYEILPRYGTYGHCPDHDHECRNDDDAQT
ncbi:MAG: hypothetical protein QF399_07535 [Gammaproteobacteria bacterium]|nr:hypothetical protein [Gammaproteobacteria bacterium]